MEGTGRKWEGLAEAEGQKEKEKDDEGPERLDGRQKSESWEAKTRRTEVSKRQEAQGGREER